MYTCVSCLTQSPTLYHDISSLSTKSTATKTAAAVKLTRCQNCQHTVDHYIEHEALLIGIDLVLLRLPAYRHLYLNREPFASFCLYNDVQERKDNHCANDEHERHKTSSTKKAFSCLLVAALLDAYHKFESMQLLLARNGANIKNLVDIRALSPTSLFVHLLASSFLEHVLFLLGVSLYVYAAIPNKPGIHQDDRLISRLFLGVILPTSFRFLSIFILIWENSDTVRILASFFVLLFQLLSIHTILQRLYHFPQSHLERLSTIVEQWIPSSSCLICGIILRSFVPFGIYQIFHYFSLEFVHPCSGYEISIPSIILDSNKWRTLCIT